MNKVCSVQGCPNDYRAKGFCSSHWNRWKRYGNPSVAPLNTGIGKTKEEKFWSKVDIKTENECWEWLPTKGKNKHGRLVINKVQYGAHRVAWFYTYKEWPSLWILHSCDNPPCCNPNHLREGTPKENSEDRNSRMRHMHGETHYNAKIDEEKARNIKKLSLSGISDAEVVKKLNVPNKLLVSRIRRGITWKHLQ